MTTLRLDELINALLASEPLTVQQGQDIVEALLLLKRKMLDAEEQWQQGGGR